MAKKSKRSYGLAPEEIESLTAQFKETKRLPNPYRTGAYRFTVEALLALGADEFHPLAKVRAAFKKAAGPEWYTSWSNKEARTDSGKDADERFVQNLRVLQRTSDFAKRLLDVGQKVLRSKGAVIDITRGAGDKLLVRLNLNSSQPQKPERVGGSNVTGVARKRPNFQKDKGPRRQRSEGKTVKKSNGSPSKEASTASAPNGGVAQISE